MKTGLSFNRIDFHLLKTNNMPNSVESKVEQSLPMSQRVHSLDLLEQFGGWQLLLDRCQTEPAKDAVDALQKLVLRVASEATYLGFPRTSRLCRVLVASLGKVAISKTSLCNEQTPEKLSALRKCLEGVAALMSDPQDDAVEVAKVTQKLRLAFDLTEGDIAAPLANLSLEGAIGAASEANLAAHRDLDVYLNARLDTLDRCVAEETWIVSQLAGLAEDLASGLRSQRPAQRLMQVLRSHKFFHQVDRVCLAGRVPNANQLMIVDASTTERCRASILKPGYSCFVNPDGSLFTLRPGTMRIFDDSDRVLQTFAASGRPAQRSIALIDDMGLRSGLCLAIGRECELQGFLFLNSCQPELFRDITINFAPLISLLGLVATIALDSNGFHKSCGRFGHLDGDLPKASILFNSQEFKMFVERAVQRRVGPNIRFNLDVQASDSLSDFLYLPAQVAGTIGELIMRLQLINANTTQLTMSIRQREDVMQVGIPHRATASNTKQWEWMRWQVDFLNNFIGNTPLKLIVDESEVSLTFPLEPILQGHREIRYSVVY